MMGLNSFARGHHLVFDSSNPSVIIWVMMMLSLSNTVTSSSSLSVLLIPVSVQPYVWGFYITFMISYKRAG